MHTYEGAGEYAEITVPSLTPSSLPANTKESTAAITAMDTSKQILVVPKFVFHVRTIARTKDSPGSMTTSAKTSIYTPTPRIRHPMRRYTIFMMSKYDGYRNLKDVLQFKVLSQDDQLQYDQKDTEKDGKVSKCKWKIKT